MQKIYNADMTSIATITGRGQITIPASVRQQLNLSVGNKVIIFHSNETITIKPLPKETDIMTIYASVKEKKGNLSLQQIAKRAKEIKAEKTATQEYLAEDKT